MSNPLGFFYKSTQNWQQFAGRTGMLVTGPCNRYSPEFQQAREAGAEVLTYIGFIERPDRRVCALSETFYMGDHSKVPLWPYPRPGARTNFPNYALTDIREESPWFDYAVDYVHKLMDEKRVDGVFLDVLGARLWKRANWDSWPVNERAEYANSCVAFVREIDRLRRRTNPDFIVVNNNVWSQDGGKTFLEGEKYVDGVCIEHIPITRVSAVVAAGRQYSDLGHRRVLWVARSRDEAQVCAQVPGVTHVSDQKTYGHPDEPPVPFSDLKSGARPQGD